LADRGLHDRLLQGSGSSITIQPAKICQVVVWAGKEPLMTITLTGSPSDCPESRSEPGDPPPSTLFEAFLIAIVLVAITRVPVARRSEIESDEFGYLEQIRTFRPPSSTRSS
jgi:hypothetical protein